MADDLDDDSLWDMLTPENTFAGVAIILLIAHIIYEYAWKKSSVSSSYISCSVCGLIITVLLIKWMGALSSTIGWALSAFFIMGTLFFYKAFIF